VTRLSFASLFATRPSLAALTLRIAAGVIFVAFSTGKFRRYDAEVNAFDRYGIPFPEVTTYLVGVLELVGGFLLVIGFLTRPVAVALAGNMIGAIVTAGRIDGGAVNLGLAPALLLAMLVLLKTGAGARSIDLRVHRWLTTPRAVAPGV
jgi:putative oxidoreductase